VLLLHSLAAHSHWWDWVAPPLAERHHVVAVDFRGHGGSAWADSYRFDDYVADVVASLDVLGWRAPLVIGHSMGGYVAALLAARHPERVGALVIADMLTGWSDEMDRRARTQAERAPAEFASAAAAGERFRLAPPDTTAPHERLHHLGEAGAVERGPGVWSLAFDRRVFLHPPPDPWPFLGAVAAATLVVRGAGSVVMPREAVVKVANTIPRGQPFEITGAFHHLVLDAPEEFAARVLRWEQAVS
jgi:pimeloyl-ACP methyl ester carboxylesterase